MNKSESKADRTKQYIVEKTAPVFNIKGYAGTSINDLMNATGLSRGSIYGNFENKDEVALAAFDYNFGKVVTYIREKTAIRTGCIDKLLVYPETYRDLFTLPFLEAGCPLLNTSAEADDTHPLLREKAVKALKLWKTSIELLVKKGIKTKEINPCTNAPEFTAILMSLIEGAVMQAKLTGQLTELNFSLSFLEDMIKNLKV
ncbi:TetR/AcrR family transcriptional regulator [Daejeonella sp.]|uniref:TetR/AcrR family transcriptional regulator n=1 Tax=Daejeonella sp. TaxID=2805397 RepID=UPI00271B3350|nr:TetR/AcrR family transcriptional regulator [Daejeonella sp.]MDO8993000.1 TetR/AcrR family transcriptional regulator [Daejeonella sp.]MDP2415017.1 TetR/AcrR family transcriptional regulator [Daejeonella sp.]